MLLSPCGGNNLDDNSQSAHLHNVPLTPRPPTSEDPYGLGAFSNKKKTEEPLITKELLLEAKTEPSKKGSKANFFNKLKKSAGASKQEATVKTEQSNVSQFDPNPTKHPETTPQTSEPAPETQTPKEEPKSAKTQDRTKEKKKPKVIIQINNEEEINALKEELEILELQLAGEDDETAREEWNKEILRVKQQIQLKTAQPDPTKDATETPEQDSPCQQLKSPAEEMQEKPAPSPKSQTERQGQPTDPPKDTAESTGESKAKKKGSSLSPRRLRLDAEQTEEQSESEQQPVAVQLHPQHNLTFLTTLRNSGCRAINCKAT